MNTKENKAIMEAIKFFTKGKFGERKPYLKEAYSNKGALYNGFRFNKEVWCWVVWKVTDIDSAPQYKGESLCKVIPDNVPVENIPVILDAQPWTYI